MIDTGGAARLRFVSVSGTPFERGRALGAALGARIRAFLGEGVARLEWVLGRAVDRDRLSAPIGAHAALIERHLPEIADEIHGLAEGAGITIEDAYLLQMRREIVAAPATDCTTIVRERTAVIAQTIDLPGRLRDLAVAVRTECEAGVAVQVTFAGLLGYVGMNDRGLAVGINMLQAAGSRPGIPPYLIVRRLLELESAEACIDEIARLPRASPRCYTLVDRTTAAAVETTCDAMDVMRGSTLVHTNHYLSERLSTLDRSHIVHRRESRRRREHALAELGRLEDQELGEIASERLFDVLSAHGESPVCIHGPGDPRLAETVAAVVLCPMEGQLLARLGPPCSAVTQVLCAHGEPAC